MSKKTELPQRESEDKTDKREKEQLDDKARESAQKSAQDEKPFDFGGLPDRDLKKNLGCG